MYSTLSTTGIILISFLFSLQFAVYSKLPIVPFEIVISFSGISPLLPVQPSKIYPSLVGLGILNSSSIVYLSLIFSNIPPFKL